MLASVEGISDVVEGSDVAVGSGDVITVAAGAHDVIMLESNKQ
jgi:hypothetical protein